MNNQYIQWLSGPRRGDVESAEMMQDGQTFEDVVILSNGRRMPMAHVGKDFIVLPSSSAALGPIDLDIMYPKPNQKQNRQAPKNKQRDQPIDTSDHASIMGFDVIQENDTQSIKQERKKQRQLSSFSSDLLARSKKSNTKIKIEVEVDMPTSAFFSMMNETFDETTIAEIIDLIVESIDQDHVRNAIKDTITKFYEGE